MSDWKAFQLHVEGLRILNDVQVKQDPLKAKGEGYQSCHRSRICPTGHPLSPKSISHSTFHGYLFVLSTTAGTKKHGLSCKHTVSISKARYNS